MLWQLSLVLVHFCPIVSSQSTMVKNFRSFAYFKQTFVEYYLVKEFPMAAGLGTASVPESQCALSCLLQEGCNTYLSLPEETAIYIGKHKRVSAM